uniref:NADH-ubiquinone oxidoreductase chain 2 n=1 Tax=Zinaida nascens TaxID=1328976 RepID=A0A0B5A0N7_ZINNA|nr:NADH dehydrogenase subunit 2 [Zinaida nascens]AJD80539.1 NADH dehydrogenase subunit 2 [Zinaida nascens]
MYFFINSNLMFLFFMFIFSTLMSKTSNSWMGCWMGLEINLLSFIPLISNSNNLLNWEASLKYFLSEPIATINFLFSILVILLLVKKFQIYFFFTTLINSSMMMKMGSAPFHFWFPNIVEGMTSLNCFILMSWQKITPMILMSYYINNNFMMLIILINSLIGAIGGINQTSLRKFLSFSSINNLGWMLLSIMISENLFLIYFIMYSFFISIMCFLFYMMNIYLINQLFIFNFNYMMKFLILLILLSMGGLPPFLGYLPKWIIVNFLMIKNLYIITFIFIMISLISLFFYNRKINCWILFNYSKFKWFNVFIKNKFFWYIIFFSLISSLGTIFTTMYFF